MKYLKFIILIVNFIIMIVNFSDVIVNFIFTKVRFIITIVNFSISIVNFNRVNTKNCFSSVKDYDKPAKEHYQSVYVFVVNFMEKIVSLVQGDDFDCKPKNFIIK